MNKRDYVEEFTHFVEMFCKDISEDRKQEVAIIAFAADKGLSRVRALAQGKQGLVVEAIANAMYQRPEYIDLFYEAISLLKKREIKNTTLGRKAKRILVENGINTIDDISKITKKDLFRTRGIGRKTIDEISHFCKENNIAFY